jgi:hypothetical protein
MFDLPVSDVSVSAGSLTVAQNGDRVSVTSFKGDALRQAKNAAGNNPLDGLTLAQALAYIDANVVDLLSARIALKNLAQIVFVMQAEREREKVAFTKTSGELVPMNTR